MNNSLRILLLFGQFIFFSYCLDAQTIVYVPGSLSTPDNYPTIDLALANASNDLRIVLTAPVATPVNGFTFPTGHAGRKVEFYGIDTLTSVIDGSSMSGAVSMMGTGVAALVYNMSDRLGSIKFTNIKVINAHTEGNGSVLNTNSPVSLTVENAVFANHTAGLDGGIFYIRHDTGTPNPIIFRQSRLRNNRAARGGLGYIQNRGVSVDLEFDNCEISNNVAVGTSSDVSYGGGLVSIFPLTSTFGSNVRINSCNIVDNSSQSDGGLFYIGNQVAGASKNKIEVVQSRFLRNRCVNNGGVFYYGRGYHDISVISSFFENNKAELENGAVFYVHRFSEENSSFLIDASTFLKNRAGVGGSVLYTGELSSRSIFRIRNHSLFKENTAAKGSGGVFNVTSVGNDVTFDFMDFTASRNYAGEDGGVLYNAQSGQDFTFLCTNGILNDNAAGIDEIFEPENAHPKGNGGVMYVGMIGAKSTFTFDNLEFVSNSSLTGGGGVFYTDEVANTFHFSMNNLDVRDNWSARHGGALNLGERIDEFSIFTIKNSTFENNESRSEYGGGAIVAARMLAGGGTHFNFEDLEFRGNQARERGGAVCLAGYDDTNYFNCKMKRVRFYNNLAGISGGALHFTNAMIDISEATFIENRVQTATLGGLGGGAEFDYADVVLTNSLFINNHADTGGAIAHSRSRRASTRNTVFVNNTASLSGIGGATYHSINSYSTDYFNCLFSGNSAGLFAGAIYQRASGGTGGQAVPIVNCTFYNNSTINNDDLQSPISAGAVFSHTASNIANSVFYNNISPAVSSVKDVNFWVPTASAITTSSMQLTNSAAYGNPTLIGITLFGNTDPGFVNISGILGSSGTGRGTDAGLRLTHPLMINTGTNSLNTTVTDLAGLTRFEGVIDMGAYEKSLVLPVKLIKFSVVREESMVHVSWSTTMETNSCCFEIQHSPDGKTWESIGKVNASSSYDQQRDYTFTYDKSSAVHPLYPIDYYRLKMLDNDGSFAFSDITSLKGTMGTTVSFYPNPVRDNLRINSVAMSSISSLEIISMSGIVVLRSFAPFKSNSVNIGNIDPGSYIICLTQGDGQILTGRITVVK